MTVNLIACAFWLIVAAVIFATGDPRFVLHLGGVQLSSGWLALVLALYNVARWWSLRSYRRQRQEEQEALARRFRRRDEELPRPEQPPDPNFNFTEPPAGPEGGKPPG
jgi:hypothetical protein